VNGFTDFQQNSDSQTVSSAYSCTAAVLHGRAHPRIQTVKSGSREAELSGTTASCSCTSTVYGCSYGRRTLELCCCDDDTRDTDAGHFRKPEKTGARSF
jgi:hypothetical protein